ncbi:MAG: S9 family peptidase [Bacilli bacterium]
MKKSNIKSLLKPVEIADLYTYSFISAITLSPDTKTTAFIVSKANKEENNYHCDLYVLKDNETLQLTTDGKASFFIYLDNDHLLFSTKRDLEDKNRSEAQDEFTSFYVISLNGGEAKKAFTVPFDASSIKRISDNYYLLSAQISLDHPDYYKLKDSEKEKIQKERKENADYEVLDESPFYFNGAGFINKKRNVLFTFNSLTKETVLVSDPKKQVGCFDLADNVVYYSSSLVKETPVVFSSLIKYDLKTKKNQELLKPLYNYLDVKVFNDGLLLTMTDFKKYGINETGKEYFYSLKDKTLKVLADNEEGIPGFISTDVHYGSTRYTKVDSGNYYYLTPINNRLILNKIDKDGNTSSVVDHVGAINDFDVINGKVVFSADFDMKLNEIYALNGTECLKLTSLNDDALKDKYVAKPNKLTIKSEGLDIDGFVLYPNNFNPKKKYPAILDIHGGPKAIYGEVFMQEMQVWTGRGYFVFFANPFGGDGRGNKFADLRDKYGTVDYKNLMDFTDAVLAKYPNIDQKKVNVTGGSYGGFMTNWIITHTHRFNCAATQRSISNWVSMLGCSDIGINDIVSSYEVGKKNQTFFTEDGIKNIWNMSPLKSVDTVTTPTLFIHSDEDHRCPIEEGYQLFTALLYKNVETRMIVFHGENHELSRSGKPKHRERRLMEINDWFDKHSK